MCDKVAPPARSLDRLETAQDAVPLVPDDGADCCRAIQRATGVNDLGTALREQVFLADELLEAVENGHRTPGGAFKAVRESVPRWERRWRDTAEELLAWAALFGLVTVTDGTVRAQ